MTGLPIACALDAATFAEVTVEPGDGLDLLEVTGPPGTTDFLAQLIGG